MFMDILFCKKRKRSWLLLFLICGILFSGCDPASHKKPDNFPNTKWVCEELNIWFIVDSVFPVVYYGQIEQESAIQELGFCCGAGYSGCIYVFDAVSDGRPGSKKASKGVLWLGEVVYGEDKFVLTESTSNRLFSEDDFPIEFVREDLTEEEIRKISPWDEEGNLKDRGDE